MTTTLTPMKTTASGWRKTWWSMPPESAASIAHCQSAL